MKVLVDVSSTLHLLRMVITSRIENRKNEIEGFKELPELEKKAIELEIMREVRDDSNLRSFVNTYSNNKVMEKPMDEEFMSSLFVKFKKIFRETKTTKEDMILLFDPKKNWRAELFDLYKDGRENDIVKKIIKKNVSIFQDVSIDLGFKGVKTEGLEADDEINREVQRIRKDSDEPIIIVSKDVDMQQISFYHENVQYMTGSKAGKYVFANLTKEEALFKTLKKILGGDPSDGLPNTKSKIGPATMKKEGYLEDGIKMNTINEVVEYIISDMLVKNSQKKTPRTDEDMGEVVKNIRFNAKFILFENTPEKYLNLEKTTVSKVGVEDSMIINSFIVQEVEKVQKEYAKFDIGKVLNNLKLPEKVKEKIKELNSDDFDINKDKSLTNSQKLDFLVRIQSFLMLRFKEDKPTKKFFEGKNYNEQIKIITDKKLERFVNAEIEIINKITEDGMNKFGIKNVQSNTNNINQSINRP